MHVRHVSLREFARATVSARMLVYARGAWPARVARAWGAQVFVRLCLFVCAHAHTHARTKHVCGRTEQRCDKISRRELKSIDEMEELKSIDEMFARGSSRTILFRLAAIHNFQHSTPILALPSKAP